MSLKTKKQSIYESVTYPVSCNWVYTNIYGNDIDFSTFKREFIELLEAIYHLNGKEIKKEFIQVYTNGLLLLHKHTGLNIPMFGCKSCIEDFVDRLKVWEYAFKKYEKTMKLSYFREGNNWKRPEKVISILGKGNVDISLQEALQLIKEMERVSEI